VDPKGGGNGACVHGRGLLILLERDKRGRDAAALRSRYLLEAGHFLRFIGLDTAFAQLREKKPYLFHQALDANNVHARIGEFGRRDIGARERRIADFVKSEPDKERVFNAIRTGSFPC